MVKADNTTKPKVARKSPAKAVVKDALKKPRAPPQKDG